MGLLSYSPRRATPGDLSPLGRESVDLLARFLALRYPGIAQFSPLRDLRGIDALLPRIRAAPIPGDRVLIRGEVVKFLLRGERTPGRATARTGAQTAVAHGTIVAHGDQQWVGPDGTS
jgi:hypothetical protein